MLPRVLSLKWWSWQALRKTGIVRIYDDIDRDTYRTSSGIRCPSRRHHSHCHRHHNHHHGSTSRRMYMQRRIWLCSTTWEPVTGKVFAAEELDIGWECSLPAILVLSRARNAHCYLYANFSSMLPFHDFLTAISTSL